MPSILAPLVIDEITVVGSRCGPFRPAIQALVDDLVDVRSMIAARCALSTDALDKAGAPGALKVLIEVSPGRPATT